MYELIINLLPLSITLIQLSDAYLRYLAFRGQMSEDTVRLLWVRLGIWGLCSMVSYFMLFRYADLTVITYKLVLMLGWIPYLAIFMATVRQNVLQHIFVFGMSSIWALSLHNWSSIVIAAFFMELPEQVIISVHAGLYLPWFLLLFPIIQNSFRHILLPRHFFTSGSHGYFIALFPLAILFSPLLLLADEQLVHSWQEHVSCLFQPVFFFFLYRYVLLCAREFYDHRAAQRDSQRMERQSSFLDKYYRIVLRNQRRIAILRHDLRHNFRLLYAMVEDGKLDEAKAHIEAQKKQLDTMVEVPFAKSPLVNAAVSIYVWQAQKLGIPIHQKILLPETFTVDEDDLAVLLANLLENAVNASKKEPPESRFLFLLLDCEDHHWTMEIENNAGTPLSLGKDGLPHKKGSTEGFGMQSLAMFLKKYSAQAQFSYANGCVKFSMHWEEAAPC